MSDQDWMAAKKKKLRNKGENFRILSNVSSFARRHSWSGCWVAVGLAFTAWLSNQRPLDAMDVSSFDGKNGMVTARLPTPSAAWCVCVCVFVCVCAANSNVRFGQRAAVPTTRHSISTAVAFVVCATACWCAFLRFRNAWCERAACYTRAATVLAIFTL